MPKGKKRKERPEIEAEISTGEPEELQTQVLTLTRQQKAMLEQAEASVQQAQQQRKLVLASIFAAKDIDSAAVLKVEGDKLFYI